MTKTGVCIDYRDIEEKIPQVIGLGAESISLMGKNCLTVNEMKELAKRVSDLIGDSGVTVSSIGVYGNPLWSLEDLEGLKILIDTAADFHTDIVGTFAGAVPGESVETAIPVFKRIFSEIARRAEVNGVRIAFENCLQGGNWKNATRNIAFHPKAWEMMFHEVPSESLGLEWEPAHQIAQLIKPTEQLKLWADKIFHVHGKDANINAQYIMKYGVYGDGYITQYCYPGDGTTNWSTIMQILKNAGYQGSIDIEPCKNPEYSGQREEDVLGRSLRYLKDCRNLIFRKE